MKMSIRKKIIAGTIVFFILYGVLAAITSYNRRLLLKTDDILLEMNHGQTFTTAEIDAAVANRQEIIKQVDLLLIGGGILTLLMGIMGTVYFSRTLVAPLEKLKKRASSMLNGEYRQIEEIRTGDEIEELANEFNAMAGKIADKFTKQVDLIEKQVDLIGHQRMMFEGIIDAMPFHIYVIDKDFNVIVWNKKREDGIFGVKREDAVGKNFWQVLDINESKVLSPKDRAEMEKEFVQVFRTGAILEKEEVSHNFGDKSFFKIAKIPLMMPDSQTGYVITILEDITERRMLEMRILAKERLSAIGMLAAGVAHEINNPMAAIAVCVDSLKKRLISNRVVKKEDIDKLLGYAKIIEDEIFRCKNITTALLSFGKDRAPAFTMGVNINMTIAETIRLITLQEKYRQFNVHTDFDEHLPMITADEGQLRQVFLALMINAFEAMKPGEILSITTKNGIHSSKNDEDSKAVKVEFKDSGCGIPKENLERIFEAFFTTKGLNGTGLGLSISYGIINQHGGKIEVESEVGKGSAFTISLPLNPLKRKGME